MSKFNIVFGLHNFPHKEIREYPSDDLGFMFVNDKLSVDIVIAERRRTVDVSAVLHSLPDSPAEIF